MGASRKVYFPLKYTNFPPSECAHLHNPDRVNCKSEKDTASGGGRCSCERVLVKRQKSRDCESRGYHGGATGPRRCHVSRPFY